MKATCCFSASKLVSTYKLFYTVKQTVCFYLEIRGQPGKMSANSLEKLFLVTQVTIRCFCGDNILTSFTRVLWGDVVAVILRYILDDYSFRVLGK